MWLVAGAQQAVWLQAKVTFGEKKMNCADNYQELLLYLGKAEVCNL